MTKTNQKYINEFSFLDEVTEAIENCNKYVEESVSLYNKNVKQLEMQSFFESVDDVDILLEKEQEGLLTKVGNAVMTVIQKFADFIRRITEKFTSKTHLVKSDIEKVNQMMMKNPELKNKVCEGLNKKWFTYKDVAQYEKDVLGLMMMLEKSTIDHKTFKDKIADATDKFNKSAAPILATAGTVSGLLLAFPKLQKCFKSFKSSADNVKSSCESFLSHMSKKFGNKDADIMKTVNSTISTVISNISSEGNANFQGMEAVAQSISDVVSGFKES